MVSKAKIEEIVREGLGDFLRRHDRSTVAKDLDKASNMLSTAANQLHLAATTLQNNAEDPEKVKRILKIDAMLQKAAEELKGM